MTARTAHTPECFIFAGYGQRGAVFVWIFSASHDAGRVVSLPPSIMGQYFKAVNIDKKEVVCPWCLGGLAKLWEWAASPQGAIFTLLLRRSSGGGGGDFYDCLPRPYRIDVDSQDPEDATKAIVDAIQKGVAAEGKPIDPPENTIVGRWAGDRVCLVGDYDESGLFEEADSFRNISREVLDAWNGFIEIPDMQLKYNPGCSCSQKNEARVD